MSEKPDSLTVAREAPARIEKAAAVINALCQPRGTEGAREWILSIPARPDHDPDIIIAEVLRDCLKLAQAVIDLSAALKQAADALECCYNVQCFPADGSSTQDEALAVARAALDGKDLGGQA